MFGPVRSFVSRLWKPSLRLAPLALAAMIAGCSEEDMVVQPKYLPLEESPLFANGQASRPLEPGTIARGQLFTDSAFETGRVDDETLAAYIPLKGFEPGKADKLDPAEARLARRETLERGRQRYDIYCSPCHGRTGEGNGMIVQRGFSKPPSLHEERLRDAPPGHYFHVITNGYGAMYSYASRINPSDRWAITAYIRALQLSQHAQLADAPEAERSKLQGEGATR